MSAEGSQSSDNGIYVHPSSYVDEGAKIGKGTRIWHFCHVQRGASVGDGCTLGQNVYIGENVTVGSRCKIQNNVSVYSGVTLEDDVFCGPSCVFTNDLHPRAADEEWECLSTIVKRGASIGANATVVCGNTIGENAMVAAGAVVTRDVPDNVLVAGVPAKFVRRIE